MLLIPALPLTAAIIGYLFKRLGLTGAVLLGIVANLAVLGFSAILFAQQQAYFVAQWISLPDYQALLNTGFSQTGLEIPLAFLVNPKSLLFIITTAAVSIAVLAYAHQERQGDPRGRVLVCTLSLFSGAMLLFLTADTLLIIYFAWELMGLCSYLLIAHNGTSEALRAARQAFWTTRTTDFALLFAIIIAMGRYGVGMLSQLNIMTIVSPLEQYAKNLGLSISSPEIEALRNTEYYWIGAILLLVLVAVIGKSALLPLSFWLPDAMVAPTPVSALLHAATMVAAGPYLLIQLGELFVYSEMAMVAATLVGAMSLIFGGVMALCSTDPKRILAYSTVSHMGLVVLGVGVLTAGPAYLHLLAHAWFKAALFIGVGLVVAQQARKSTLPTKAITTLKVLAGAARGNWLLVGVLVLSGLSLAGLWGFGGYFGKEHIFSALLLTVSEKVNDVTMLADNYPVAEAAWRIGWAMLLFSFAITAAYITRLIGILCFKPSGVNINTANATPGGVGEIASRSSFWPATNATLVSIAVVGSLGLGAGWHWAKLIITPDTASLMWMAPDKYPYLWIVGLAFTLVGGLITYAIRVAKPGLGDQIARDDGALAWLKAFFGNGMYLREFWTTLVGQTGELLAILAAITDVGVVDSLVLSSGKAGRTLARISAWLDKHFIDGARYWACEICWKLKAQHGRYLQTGRIQRYMLIIVVWTAILCLIITKPLGEVLIPFLENMIKEGII